MNPLSRRTRSLTAISCGVVLGLLACTKDEAIEDPVPETPGGTISPVHFDLNTVPYDSLSTYGFFAGDLADLEPVAGLVPFQPITPLFSDYAHKSRYVWMPAGASASYVSDSTALSFPNGAVLIKNFYYDHVQPLDERRVIETRLLFRRNGAWEAANYVWNEEQTEAVLDLAGSYLPLTWVDDDGTTRSTQYRIPSISECEACHKLGDLVIPIGPKPQNLNSDFNYPDGTMNQFDRWVQAGYLSPSFPANIETVVRWDDPAASLLDRVRSYVDMNCSHCHANDRYCDYRPMRFAWHETTDPANLGVCVEPHDPLLPIHTHIVKPGNLEKSLLYYRISSTEVDERMPLLGRTLVHEEARALIGAWIESMTQPCN